MKEADWTDEEGRKWRVRLPDDAPDSEAPGGFPVGPPNLADLGLPLEVEVRLHNQLHARGLWTEREVRRSKGSLFASLQAAYGVDVVVLNNLYGGG